jgi:hypothetical protein
MTELPINRRPVSARDVVDASKKLVSAINNASRPFPEHAKNDGLAAEVHMASWMSEFTGDVCGAITESRGWLAAE